LAIFMDVSVAFEGLQRNWFFKHVTDSGFSVEDLVSNLVGFYRALYPGIDFIRICEPVSKAESLEIWDEHGAVGENKNEEFKPILYHNPKFACGIPRISELPPQLNTIRPAVAGESFMRIQ